MTAPKKGISNWIKFGVPVAVVVIVGAVLGGVLGSRAHNNNKKSSTSSSGDTSSPSGEAAASSAAVVKNAVGVFPTGTDSQYLLPLYPSTVSSLGLAWLSGAPFNLTPYTLDQCCCIHLPHIPPIR